LGYGPDEPQEAIMKQRLLILVASAALGLGSLGLSQTDALANANAPAGCTKIKGTIYCTSTNPYGNDEHSQSKKTTTTTTTKKGSEQSSHPKESSCDGNKGQCKNQK
jgi:hypothetical protein